MVEFAEKLSDKDQGKLDKKNGSILILSLLVAVLYDFLFYEKVAGLSYPIFIIVLYAVMYQKKKEDSLKGECFQWFLTLTVLALAFTYLLNSNQVLETMNSILIPVIFVAHILLITEKRQYDWFRCGFLKDIFHGLLIRPVEHVPKIVHLIPELMGRDNELTKDSIIKRVLVGIVFSLPVLGAVITLLSSADLMFGKLVNEVLSDVHFSDIIKQTLLIGFIAVLAGSYLWGLTYSTRERVLGRDVDRKMDEVSILTGLCLLNIVYGVFSYIQFAYLFGGLSNLLPEGFTYAEYARRGFFELVVAATVNVAIVLGSLNLTKISGVLSDRIFKILNSGLVVSTLVMLFSSFVRMHLYEEVFGYTYLRVFTHGLSYCRKRNCFSRKCAAGRQQMRAGHSAGGSISIRSLRSRVFALNSENGKKSPVVGSGTDIRQIRNNGYFVKGDIDPTAFWQNLAGFASFLWNLIRMQAI